MSEPRDLPELDEPPRDGVFRELHDEPLTEEEAERGRLLGERIDPDDDLDNGLGHD